MRIREATPGDYAGLCVLMAEVHRLHLQHLPRRFQDPAGPICGRQYLEGLIADEDVCLFIAEWQGEPVGYVNVAIRESLDIPILVPRRYAHIGDLVVRHDRRRAGVGRALMMRAHEWARAKEATAVELNVYEFNAPAMAFYREMGYETVSRSMSRALDGG